MRKPPASPPPAVHNQDNADIVTEVRHYRLMTPLFGGGVKPAEADPVTVVRGPEIRGHLRFWWRACQGGRFNGDLAQMKEAEDKLWGAASTEARPRPSQVQISIALDSEGQADRPFEVIAGSPDRRGNPRPRVRPRRESTVPPYGAFPLQPSEREAVIGMQTKAVRIGVAFTLTISYPEKQQAEVEAALWAWETFGGVGARTRRGFGALQCVSIDGQTAPVPPADRNQAVEWIKRGLQKHVAQGQWPTGVPHLSQDVRFKVVGSAQPSLRAWESLLGELKAFRQKRPGLPNHPGRSQWPEPDAIRRLTGQAASSHPPVSNINKFPRAAFGLPIIFHFKDRDDPADTTLKGAKSERLTSPLILRPLACANDQTIGLALILETPYLPPDGLVLKDDRADRPVQSTLSAAEAKGISPLSGKTDILQAFLDTL